METIVFSYKYSNTIVRYETYYARELVLHIGPVGKLKELNVEWLHMV